MSEGHIGSAEYRLVNGRMHYIDIDYGGRQVIGIVRHGARGLLNWSGLPWRRTSRPKIGPSPDAGPSTVALAGERLSEVSLALTTAMGRAYRTVSTTMASLQVSEYPFGPLALEAKLKRDPWWRRSLLAIVAFFTAYIRVGDPDWHRSVRATATSVVWTAFCISATIFLGRLVWLILTVMPS